MFFCLDVVGHEDMVDAVNHHMVREYAQVGVNNFGLRVYSDENSLIVVGEWDLFSCY